MSNKQTLVNMKELVIDMGFSISREHYKEFRTMSNIYQNFTKEIKSMNYAGFDANDIENAELQKIKLEGLVKTIEKNISTSLKKGEYSQLNDLTTAKLKIIEGLKFIEDLLIHHLHKYQRKSVLLIYSGTETRDEYIKSVRENSTYYNSRIFNGAKGIEVLTDRYLVSAHNYGIVDAKSFMGKEFDKVIFERTNKKEDRAVECSVKAHLSERIGMVEFI